MKLKSAMLLSIALFASNTAFAHELDAEARGLAKEFSGKLKPELKKAMKSGGPMAAIEVCHTKAPQIAKEMSDQKGWEITRVSDKPRGAMAETDKWEKMVLASFAAKKNAGVDPKTIEYSAVVNDNGQKTYRYMKAIGTKGLCLKCHGTNIDSALQAKIDKYYPNDKATGYQEGQLRGAFSFKKVLN